MFTKEELQKVKGVGQKTAERIETFLEENNTENVYELLEVHKVGDYLLNNIMARFPVMEMEFDLKELEEVEKVEELHLVGDMNDWQPADKRYSFINEKDSIWFGAFRLEEGTEYKVLYNSENWEEDKCLSAEHNSNFKVGY